MRNEFVQVGKRLPRALRHLNIKDQYDRHAGPRRTFINIAAMLSALVTSGTSKLGTSVASTTAMAVAHGMSVPCSCNTGLSCIAVGTDVTDK